MKFGIVQPDILEFRMEIFGKSFGAPRQADDQNRMTSLETRVWVRVEGRPGDGTEVGLREGKRRSSTKIRS